ncbi:MAG: (2Fe-2S)-binding protein [Nannocystis sp.]|nr:(2Fe-2S)-binding protein [Nannocystis sp.]
MLCGCVGLTRGQLDALQTGGCRSVEAVCARTGAGSVCGGCVPLIRRMLAEPDAGPDAGPGAATPSGAAEDEVDLDVLEARLDELRHVDGARSLVGPGAGGRSLRIVGRTHAGRRPLFGQPDRADAVGRGDGDRHDGAHLRGADRAALARGEGPAGRRGAP